MKNADKPIKIKTDISCFDLDIEEWRFLAGFIDTDYNRSGDSFRVKERPKHLFIYTDKCDSIPSIKVFYNSKYRIEKIERISDEDDKGYVEIQKETYLNIENFLKTIKTPEVRNQLKINRTWNQ